MALSLLKMRPVIVQKAIQLQKERIQANITESSKLIEKTVRNHLNWRISKKTLTFL